jgi:hypothetical protein
LTASAEGVSHTSYICIPALRRRGLDVNIEEFMEKTGITKQSAVK